MRNYGMKGFRIGGTIAAVVLVLFGTAALAQDGQRPLELADYLSWEQVRSPQVSPDGTSVVYERRFVDATKDRWKTELWLIGADGSRNRFLTDGSSPGWAPDGSRIAFLRDGQIFVRWMDAEGAESQVTRLESPPSQLVWAPDSGSIAFRAVVDPGPDPDWAIAMPNAPEGAEWTKPPRIVTRLNYRRDGQGYFPAGFRHIFVVSADGGTPRQLTSGDFHHDGPRFVGDGADIVFTSLRTADAEHAWRESEIYRVAVATGRITALTSRSGPDSGPVPSPDGSLIAYTGMDHTTDTYREEGLYVMESDGT